MTGYRTGSKWNDLNELQCLLILKKLEAVNFTRNLQARLCRALSKTSGLSEGTLKAKVGNYKSLAGVTGDSNASTNTKALYQRYKHFSVSKLSEAIASGKAL